MKLVTRVVAVGLFLVGGVGAGPALADHKPGCTNQGNAGGNSANYAGAAADLVADDSQGSPGDKVKLHGCGYNANSNVDVDLNSAPLRMASTTTDTNGAFDVEVTIPAGAPVGRHTITATGTDPQGRPKVESVAYTVVAAAGAPSSGALPRTGSSTVPLVAGSTALLALGALLVIVARRRRRLFA